MRSEAKSFDDYIKEAPEDRQEALAKLRQVINKNLPKGFEEGMSYGMAGWQVPLATYPDGYHCSPGQALPFAGLASQKNFISFYHMAMYGDPEMLQWFQEEYTKRTGKKPDMGKSCVRFKKPAEIPFDLIGELMKKVTVEKWISFYEAQWKKKK